MIKQKYLQQLKKQINEFVGDREIKVFLFGSSLKKDHFGDIDIGLIGEFKPNEPMRLKEKIEASTLPYFIDVVDFNNADNDFKENILNNKVIWIKQ